MVAKTAISPHRLSCARHVQFAVIGFFFKIGVFLYEGERRDDWRQYKDIMMRQEENSSVMPFCLRFEAAHQPGRQAAVKFHRQH